MKKVSLALILIVSVQLSTFAQASNKTNFQNKLSWQEILLKARSENKSIFLDCYATWCAPCKAMDKIYEQENISEYLNSNFISVKVQMDTSKMDSEDIKSWYQDAKIIRTTYKVQSLPTFIFLSPDGLPLHRDIGYHSNKDFITLLNDALNPSKQYYTLLHKYITNRLSLEFLPFFARSAKKIGENEIASAVSKNYIENYLLQIDSTKLFTKENSDFLLEFTTSSSDMGFKLLYENQEKFSNLIAQKEFLFDFLLLLIAKDEIEPHLNAKNKSTDFKPHWVKIQKEIKGKYGEYVAVRATTDAKIRWFYNKKNWEEYSKNLIYKVSNFGIGTAPFGVDFEYNNNAWRIFLYSNKKAELMTALSWSERAVELNPSANWLDTQANILYKLGRKEKALSMEQKALELSMKKGTDPQVTQDIKASLDKMKNNIPTWITE